jgi:TRAP-type C4-dicarboxylate transport system permease large subunit
LPLFIAMIIALVFIILFPAITLWLPQKFGF